MKLVVNIKNKKQEKALRHFLEKPANENIQAFLHSCCPSSHHLDCNLAQ